MDARHRLPPEWSRMDMRHQTLVMSMVNSSQLPGTRPPQSHLGPCCSYTSICMSPSKSCHVPKELGYQHTKSLDQGVWIWKGDIHLMCSPQLKCKETPNDTKTAVAKGEAEKGHRSLEAWGKSDQIIITCMCQQIIKIHQNRHYIISI